MKNIIPPKKDGLNGSKIPQMEFKPPKKNGVQERQRRLIDRIQHDKPSSLGSTLDRCPRSRLRENLKETSILLAGWWFGTFFIFPYIGNNNPNWLIFFRGVGIPPTSWDTRPWNTMVSCRCSMHQILRLILNSR